MAGSQSLVETVNHDELAHIALEIELRANGFRSGASHTFPQPHVAGQHEDLLGHRWQLTSLHQKAGNTVGNQFRNPTHACVHNWFAVSHPLGNHPAEDFLPVGNLTNNIGSLIDALAKRI